MEILKYNGGKILAEGYGLLPKGWHVSENSVKKGKGIRLYDILNPPMIDQGISDPCEGNPDWYVEANSGHMCFPDIRSMGRVLSRKDIRATSSYPCCNTPDLDNYTRGNILLNHDKHSILYALSQEIIHDKDIGMIASGPMKGFYVNPEQRIFLGLDIPDLWSVCCLNISMRDY